MHCSALQYIAVHCTAVQCSEILHCSNAVLQCNALKCNAVKCSAVQYRGKFSEKIISVSPLRSCPAPCAGLQVTSTGVAGKYLGRCMGVFSLTERVSGGQPVYRQRGGDCYLYR